MNKHWTERMFIENPSLYGATLENSVEGAGNEVKGLEEIFSEFRVPRNGLVLDLCCGIGRHSVILAERGFTVVGVDLSPKYIARAKEMSAERNVDGKTEFRVGDMRQIGNLLKAYEQKFNAVINLSTSFGLFDEETDRDVLIQLLRLTTSNGIVVLDLTNRDWIIRHFGTRDMKYVGSDLVLFQERRLNLVNSRMEMTWKYYRKHGDDLKYIDTFELDHRIYSLHELKGLVEESGWTYRTCYGSFNLDRFTMDSYGMILVANKP